MIWRQKSELILNSSGSSAPFREQIVLFFCFLEVSAMYRKSEIRFWYLGFEKTFDAKIFLIWQTLIRFWIGWILATFKRLGLWKNWIRCWVRTFLCRLRQYKNFFCSLSISSSKLKIKKSKKWKCYVITTGSTKIIYQ